MPYLFWEGVHNSQALYILKWCVHLLLMGAVFSLFNWNKFFKYVGYTHLWCIADCLMPPFLFQFFFAYNGKPKISGWNYVFLFCDARIHVQVWSQSWSIPAWHHLYRQVINDSPFGTAILCLWLYKALWFFFSLHNCRVVLHRWWSSWQIHKRRRNKRKCSRWLQTYGACHLELLHHSTLQ